MIWIEVLDRRGHVAARVRCDAFPVTLGRAYTNDVVLDDRHVEAVHARLVRDERGGLVLEDAGSLNGIVTAGGIRLGLVGIAGTTVVHLGQTTVRFVPADAPVPAAVPMPAARRGLLALVTAPKAAIVIALAGLMVAGLSLWLGDPGANAVRKAVGGALALAAVLGVWAGGWALAGRMHMQRAAFLAHYAAAWLALLVLDLAGVVFDLAAFVIDQDGVAVAGRAVAGAACLVALLAAQLALATTMSGRRRAVVAVAVVAALAGFGALIGEAAKGEFDGDHVTIRAAVEPVPVGLMRARSLEAFLGEAATLRRAVDRLAEEE